ncbi:ATP-binding protein [Streptomyces anulatus]|uniref:ATP-binding protein n=1 Tax=Streptomyces anulatus TaxID=1892 RepID=UPI001C5F1E46|nr:ATP-binding protein [Streptomyces anulatus]QYA93791.1 ATP-binding protein [Streptomyces anulatus]
MSSQSFLLVRAPTSAAISRRRLVELVSTWRLPEDEDSHMAMTTVVSELVTNAVSHGVGDMLSVTVRADLGRSRLLLEVHDSSPVLPRLRRPSPDSESGRGMVLVEHLSIACGAENTVQGKRVWAELALPQEPAGPTVGLRPSRSAARPCPAVSQRLPAPLPYEVRATDSRQRPLTDHLPRVRTGLSAPASNHPSPNQKEKT